VKLEATILCLCLFGLSVLCHHPCLRNCVRICVRICVRLWLRLRLRLRLLLRLLLQLRLQLRLRLRLGQWLRRRSLHHVRLRTVIACRTHRAGPNPDHDLCALPLEVMKGARRLPASRGLARAVRLP
jgi:hypothetical protein